MRGVLVSACVLWGIITHALEIDSTSGYGEATFTARFGDSNEDQPQFQSVLTLVYMPPQFQQYADTSNSWVGKRFYRDADVNMNDFYYFADMSGNGAGVEEVFGGNWSVAYLQYADRNVIDAANGTPTKRAIDIRTKLLSLNSSHGIMFWLAPAYTPGGNGEYENKPISYSSAYGTAAGARWRHHLTDGFNDLAVMYGHGVMESLTLNNNAFVKNGDDLRHRERWRVVEHFASELSTRWALQSAIIFEQSEETWWSFGMRPTYYINDHYHLVGEAGFSAVKENDRPERTFTRLTLAPQVALGRGAFVRPVLRAYITYASWNNANRDTIAVSGRDAFNYGFQSEVWF